MRKHNIFLNLLLTTLYFYGIMIKIEYDDAGNRNEHLCIIAINQ